MKNTEKHIKTILGIHHDSYLCAKKLYKGVYVSIVFDPCGDHQYTVEVETDNGTVSGIFHCNDLSEAKSIRENVTKHLNNKRINVYEDYKAWSQAILKREELIQDSVNKTVRDIRNNTLSDFESFVVVIATREIMLESFGEENADRFIEAVKDCALSGDHQRIRRFLDGFSIYVLEDYVK